VQPGILLTYWRRSCQGTYPFASWPCFFAVAVLNPKQRQTLNLWWNQVRNTLMIWACIRRQQLKKELLSAMSDGDAVSAIKVCAQKASEMTSAHADGGWTIKRISNRNRNPNNRANFTETVLLAIFADAAGDRSTETWTKSDSGTTYQYFKPILTSSFCLKCHGDMQTLGPGVYTALKKLYPLDKATGYKAGELRGMFVVDAKWPEGRGYAEQLLTDSL